MAEIKLTIKTNFDDAQRQIEGIGQTVASETARMDRAMRNMSGDQIDALIQKNQRLAAAVTATRGPQEAMIVQQRNLRNDIERLIRNGIDPASEAMVKLRAEYARVSAEVDKNREAMKKNQDHHAGMIGGFKNIAVAASSMIAALAGGVIFAKLADYMAEGVKANEWLVESDTRLVSIATKVTRATEEQIAAMRALADATELKTAHEAEAVKVGQSQLLTFGMSADSAMALNDALNDLGAAQKGVDIKGNDLIDTANMIGKAFMGQTGAMTKAGVTMSETQKQIIALGTESQKVATIADVIAQNFGGLAESLKKTSKGEIAMMKHDLGTLQESLTAGLLPVLGTLATAISGVLGVSKLTTDTSATLELFKMLGKGVVYFGRATDMVFGGLDVNVKTANLAMSSLVVKFAEVSQFAQTKIPTVGLSKDEKAQREIDARYAVMDAKMKVAKAKTDFDDVTKGYRDRSSVYKETLASLDNLTVSQIAANQAAEQAIAKNKSLAAAQIEEKLAAEESAKAKQKSLEALEKQKEKSSIEDEMKTIKTRMDGIFQETQSIIALGKSYTDLRGAMSLTSNSSQLKPANKPNGVSFSGVMGSESAYSGLADKSLEEKLARAQAEADANNNTINGTANTNAIQLEQFSAYYEARMSQDMIASENKILYLQQEQDTLLAMKVLNADQEVLLAKTTEDKIMQIKMDSAIAQGSILSSTMANIGQSFNNMATVMKNVGAQSRGFLVAAKAASLAQIGIATKVAVVQAMADPTPMPTWLRIASAIAVGAMGATNALAVATTPIPSAETGTSFVVPNGNRTDGALYRFNQGEQVDVTPRGETKKESSSYHFQVDGRTLFSFVQEGIDSGQIITNNNVG